MSIEKNVKIIYAEYSRLGLITSNSLKKTIIRDLDNKWKTINQRLKTKANIHIHPTDWSKTLSSNEAYFFSEYNSQNKELHALFRSSVCAEFMLMSLYNKTQRNRLQGKNGKFLEDFRYPKRLVFSDNDNISSWSNIVSLSDHRLSWNMSQPYCKHLYNGKLKKISESMYGKNINPVKLEELVLEKGFGKFSQENRAFFFAKFDDEIGHIPGKNGQKIPTDILKVQVDRVTRPLKTQRGKKHRQGFFFKMHGYPISDYELQSDSGSLYNSIICNKLKVPI